MYCYFIYHAPAVAVFARTNLIETVSEQPYESMPQWFKNWEKTGLLSYDDKNGDGHIQYNANATTNELTVDRDIMVLANPEIANCQLGDCPCCGWRTCGSTIYSSRITIGNFGFHIP